MTEWNTSFKKGFATCFTICTAIAGVAIYFNSTIISLKDEQINQLETKISKQEDFSEKYHKEQAIRRQVELREAELIQQVNIQSAKKWEEKYHAENLSKQSLEEQVALLEARINDLQSKQKGTVDPKKDVEIKYLKEELELTKKRIV
jgi:2-methylcitrate dehydratase PrpD